MMQAVVLQGYGGVEMMTLSPVPIPIPGPNQLLVRVYAAGVNRADLLQRQGKYPPPVGASKILGLEIAGEIVDYAAGVQGFKQGQRVFGLVAGGAYAEYCLLDAALAMPIPDHWRYSEAAAIPEAFITAHAVLFELGELQTREVILIHAAGSGVGTAAIQMAKCKEAEVYITAGSDQKIANAIALGAKAGINYINQDFAQALKEFTNGVNLIVDFIGAPYLMPNLDLLYPGGRLVQVALMGGRRTEIDLAKLISYHLQIKGFILRQRSLADKAKLTVAFQENWFNYLTMDKIKPIIAQVLPLKDVRHAHQILEKREIFGKLVLVLE